MAQHRPLHVVLIALLLLTFFVAPVQAEPSRALITGGRSVGSFRLGKPFGPYEKALGPPTSVRSSEISDDARLVYYKRYGMYFFVKKGVVNGITVESPLFATAEGLHVGSAQSEVTRALGAPQSLRAGEVVYPERGLGFTFADGKVARIYLVEKEDRDLASGDYAIVPGVRVGGLHLGQPVSFVLGQWKDPSKRSPFPDKKDCELWSYEKKGVIVVTWMGKVDGLMIFSPAFRTSKGIHVGSARDAVVRAYGKPGAREENLESYPPAGIGFFYEGDQVKQIYVKEPTR